MKYIIIFILVFSGCASKYKKCGYTEYRWGTIYTIDKGNTIHHECR